MMMIIIAKAIPKGY